VNIGIVEVARSDEWIDMGVSKKKAARKTPKNLMCTLG
jgi:hypothetical protein